MFSKYRKNAKYVMTALALFAGMFVSLAVCKAEQGWLGALQYAAVFALWQCLGYIWAVWFVKKVKNMANPKPSKLVLALVLALIVAMAIAGITIIFLKPNTASIILAICPFVTSGIAYKQVGKNK